MSEARKHEATQAQIAAALPERSAWVSANAGSGKTRVLTNRVARLLLQGTEPAKILCLTFTKAGAAEMQNRLFKQLGTWVMLPDDALRAALAEMGAADLPEAQLIHARTLFARALETPGGLKIQTIHAFCESLLHRFPLEAQVAPDFELLDERQSMALRMEVLDKLAESSANIFAEFISLNGDPESYLNDILKHQQLFSKRFNAAKAAAQIGAEPGLTEETILHRLFEGISDADIDQLAVEMVRNANKHELNVAAALRRRGSGDIRPVLEALEAAFLTNGKPRSTTRFPVKAVKDAFPPALGMVTTFIERVNAARQSRLALVAYERAKALHDFAAEFLQRYAASKAGQSVLEFEDLIRKADALLRQSDMAQWVLYRLDGGIDHILVDEAQDTSPLQWDIVTALAEEIYAAAGESETPRTIFVVGDEKQSIFSFQGADPHEFSRIRRLLHERLQAVERPMFEGALQCSFRSAPPILQLVDRVFDGDMRGGIKDEISHISVDDALPGRVEIWPFYEKEPALETRPWDAPVDTLPEGDPVLLLAEDVAARVAEIIASGKALPGKKHPVKAGDFLILVQSRGVLFRALLKELKARGVPVAGADRLKVIEELAVKDLLAVLQFAANPQDDLNLACAMRSPLCAVSENELYKMAYGREGSLWQAMPPDEMLSDILAHADFERPFEVLERILIRHKGREKLLSRLGPEAEEGVDELLRMALEFEQSNTPSLTGFLEWIRADEIEVKRQFNNEDNLLRIMTVHGAKGLEAPIVILPQTVKKPNNTGSAVLPLGDGLAVCGLGAADLPETLQQAQQRQKELQKEEKMRLFYVAMTRAESWLIMAGSGVRNRGSDNWYDPATAALESLGATQKERGRLVLENNWKLEECSGQKEPLVDVDLPAWWNQQAEKVEKPPRPRAPSTLGGEHTVAGAKPAEDALVRGEQIHILMENLTGVPEEDRAQAALAWLEMPLEGVVDEALKTLSTPNLADVFGPDALREVPVSATLPEIGLISGRIDVLLVDDIVTAVDIKSNRDVPARAEDIPEAFLRQMGAYRAALAQIWPDREIKAAICWTATQSLMEIPSGLSDAALQRAASA